MSVDFVYHAKEDTVVCRFSGVVRDQEVETHVRNMSELFKFGTLTSETIQILDFCELDRLDKLSTDFIRKVASQNPFAPKQVRVFITPHDLSFGLSHMYKALCLEQENSGIRIVRTIEEADAIVSLFRCR